MSQTTKTSITMRIDSDLLRDIEAWRSRQRFAPDRTTVFEEGVRKFLQVEDDPDGPLEILEDMLAYYSTEAPAQFDALARKTLKSIVGDLVRIAKMGDEELFELVRDAAQAARR